MSGLGNEKMSQHISFRKWLAQFKDHQTPLGDLAREFFTDTAFKGIKITRTGYMNAMKIEFYIEQHNSEMAKVFKEGYEEWGNTEVDKNIIELRRPIDWARDIMENVRQKEEGFNNPLEKYK